MRHSLKRLLTYTAPAVALLGGIYLLANVLERPFIGAAPSAAPSTLPANQGRDPASYGHPDRQSLCDNIYEAVCKLRGVTRDPTGSVRSDVEGELEVLRTYEEIVRSHPDWDSDQVDEELVQQVYTPKRLKRVESAYEWVQASIRKLIHSQPESVFTRKERQLLIQKLNHIRLELPPPAKIYGDEPELYTKNDVYYERLQSGVTRLRIGGAYLLTARSWFNLVFTLAHELAHAIDPCEIRSGGEQLPAYDRVKSCFLREGLIAARTTRMECGRHDQLSETFADWIASQVAADALAHWATEFHGPQLLGAIANSVRDLCEQDDDPNEPDHELHPPARLRIDRIFGQNPRIQALLGCTAPANTRVPAIAPGPYCEFGSPNP